MIPHRRAASLLIAASLLALGACAEKSSGSSDADAPASSTPSAAQSADRHNVAEQQSADAAQSAASAAEAEREEQSTSPILGGQWTTASGQIDPIPGAEPLVFHALRVGEHDGFYRVVVEFTGEGTPGYFANWAETPVEQGRGRQLPVEGVSFLDLMISGTTMPVEKDQQAVYYSGPSNLAVGPLDVREDGTFEDTTHIVIGMDTAREFQIGFLHDPVRVVIDVKK